MKWEHCDLLAMKHNSNYNTVGINGGAQGLRSTVQSCGRAGRMQRASDEKKKKTFGRVAGNLLK